MWFSTCYAYSVNSELSKIIASNSMAPESIPQTRPKPYHFFRWYGSQCKLPYHFSDPRDI